MTSIDRALHGAAGVGVDGHAGIDRAEVARARGVERLLDELGDRVEADAPVEEVVTEAPAEEAVAEQAPVEAAAEEAPAAEEAAVHIAEEPPGAVDRDIDSYTGEKL